MSDLADASRSDFHSWNYFYSICYKTYSIESDTFHTNAVFGWSIYTVLWEMQVNLKLN